MYVYVLIVPVDFRCPTPSLSVLLEALNAVVPGSECKRNSFKLDVPLSDDVDYLSIGQSLPFVIRAKEMDDYQNCVDEDIKAWFSIHSLQITPDGEYGKRWAHPATAGQPGSGIFNSIHL
jgi:hypothetical protein